jgi:uncharacterized protein (DUF362 family)
MELQFIESVKKIVYKINENSFFIGLFSLVWFMLRTGMKPSRADYPCQRAASMNGYLWLTAYFVPLFVLPQKKTKKLNKKFMIAVAVIAICSITFVGVFMMGGNQQNGMLKLRLEGKLATVQPASDIFIVDGTDGKDGGFDALIGLMGEHELLFYKSSIEGKNKGFEGLIARDDVVLIKVNCQWNERGGTNTDLLKAIIEAILSHPDSFIGEIIVADNGQAQYGAFRQGGSLNWEKNNAEDQSQSAQKVVDMVSDNYKLSTYLWDDITLKRVNEYSDADMEDGYIINQTPNPLTGIKVSYPKFKTKFGTYISFKKGVWDPETKTYDSDRLKVINVPVLKSHHSYGVTASLKHYMGVVSAKQTNAHNSVGTGGMGTEMVETRFPTLNILDAIWVNAFPGNGPSTSYSIARRTNVVMASQDPVALDYWAAKNILMQTSSLIGVEDSSSMDPESNTGFGYWLRLSMDEIKKFYPCTLNENQMSVYVTTM